MGKLYFYKILSNKIFMMNNRPVNKIYSTGVSGLGLGIEKLKNLENLHLNIKYV